MYDHVCVCVSTHIDACVYIIYIYMHTALLCIRKCLGVSDDLYTFSPKLQILTSRFEVSPKPYNILKVGNPIASILKSNA